MARSVVGDFLQGYRFHVQAFGSTADTVKPFESDGMRDEETFNNAQAGFQSCSLPEMTMDSVEYREGNAKYTMKQPGIPTYTDITLMQGVTRKNTAFFDWITKSSNGNEYRVDLKIYHYSRDQISITPDDKDVRIYYCFECFPIRVKPGADLDSTGSEISLAECDIAIEYFSISNEKPN